MAESKSPQEPALPVKRKPDLTSDYQQNLPLKSPKLLSQDETIQANEGNHSAQNHALQPSGNSDSSVPKTLPENEEPGVDAEEEEEEEEDDDDYEDDDDGDDHDEEEENGNAAVDRKGKGILVEEEKDSDDDDDDSNDGGNESEGESDLSDDPLAEVDLDNILPSRTRRRVAQRGFVLQKISETTVNAMIAMTATLNFGGRLYFSAIFVV
ncbi:nucleolin-like [Durio zibethinus]|uniref:Nucleolin-like n=1 Tax=Durio zibethinus TaxID=66656 RepID=A0A6P5YJ11_DURZI|nr:nucleolin-like [Durio zibethinus]